MKPRQFSYMIDIAFEVEGPWGKFTEIPKHVLFARLLDRISRLMLEDDKVNIYESFGEVDQADVTDFPKAKP